MLIQVFDGTLMYHGTFSSILSMLTDCGSPEREFLLLSSLEMLGLDLGSCACKACKADAVPLSYSPSSIVGRV